MLRFPIRLALFGGLIAALTTACGDDDDDSGNDGDAAVGCETDPRAQAYTAGMTATGQSGTLTFVLRTADPAPPARGTNAWVVEIRDVGGDPVTTGTVSVTPFMPDHGHGTSTVPEVALDGDAWSIGNLLLFMPGLWEVTIEVDDGDRQDRATFSFCIAG